MGASPVESGVSPAAGDAPLLESGGRFAAGGVALTASGVSFTAGGGAPAASGDVFRAGDAALGKMNAPLVAENSPPGASATTADKKDCHTVARLRGCAVALGLPPVANTVIKVEMNF